MQNHVREYREAHGLSQAALGKALGVSSFTIMRWEKAYTLIPQGRLEALARFFQVTPAELDPFYIRIPTPEKVNHA